MTPLLHRGALVLALVAAAASAAALRLLFEPRHRLLVGPARARQIVVVFVAIFFESSPHMTVRLVSPK